MRFFRRKSKEDLDLLTLKQLAQTAQISQIPGCLIT